MTSAPKSAERSPNEIAKEIWENAYNDYAECKDGIDVHIVPAIAAAISRERASLGQEVEAGDLEIIKLSTVFAKSIYNDMSNRLDMSLAYEIVNCWAT